MLKISQISGTRIFPPLNDSPVRKTLAAKDTSSSELIIPVAEQTETTCWGRICDDINTFFEKIYHLFKKIFLSIWYFIFKPCCCPDAPYRIPELELETLFDDTAIEEMRENFWGLGKENMWEIIIDGEHHDKGKYVFDYGLHNGSIEPGFIVSMDENAFPLISKYLGTRTSPDFYLEVHRAACWHFKGDFTDTLMDSDRTGVFRDYEDQIVCTVGQRDCIDDADWKEMISFEPKLVKVEYTSEEKTDRKIRYIRRTPEEVRGLFTDYLDYFYNEIEQAKTRREKIRACARLCHKMDWTHLTRDGSGRAALLFLQKHLTEYVGHPCIMHDPIMMTIMGLEKFCDYIEDALKKWEDRKAAIESA